VTEEADQFQQATEAALEQSGAALSGLQARLDQMERVVLWLSKQPFELDSGFTWNNLVEKAEAGDPKPLRFKDARPDPVRDLL
jgi:hypothetical protein